MAASATRAIGLAIRLGRTAISSTETPAAIAAEGVAGFRPPNRPWSCWSNLIEGMWNVMCESNPIVQREAARRRTFAIISHPDAGKTTLTEKLLLYGGRVDVAGAVRGRKTQRAATSDWMELERQRGISVSSTVLPFEYRGLQLNLLDTPGHHDFSEDTYRTLMAAECAIMVIDLAKGIEEQTEKLFRVCALRGIPVVTFVNKADRPGREPLDILAEIEAKLGIAATAQNWPLGSGFDFGGIVELLTKTVHLFEKGSGGHRVPFRSVPLASLDPSTCAPAVTERASDEVELVVAVGEPFDRSRFLAGELTPVFFGSALTNFGVEHFLEGFLSHCPPPGARASDRGPVPADHPHFSGFIFKIQANLDPRHRDRVAFVRVCSGRFRRDMDVLHVRSGKKLRLTRSHRVFGQERETMDEAYAGDIIGLVNPGEFQLGDTICEGQPFSFEPLPQFSPEYFAVLRCTETARRKQFARGLAQLIEEGAIQQFTDPSAARAEPILAAVGELQFDVVRYRLETEYNTQTQIEWLPYKLARWPRSIAGTSTTLKLPYSAKMVLDQNRSTAVLFTSKWDAEYCAREHPAIELCEVRQPSQSAGRQQPVPTR
ncbi:MAG: peptide chain release factor 3 [Pirellulales bacterium]